MIKANLLDMSDRLYQQFTIGPSDDVYVQLQAGPNRVWNIDTVNMIVSMLKKHRHEITILIRRDDIEKEDVEVNSVIDKFRRQVEDECIFVRIVEQALCNSEAEATKAVEYIVDNTKSTKSHLILSAHSFPLGKRLKFGVEAAYALDNQSSNLHVHIVQSHSGSLNVAEWLSYVRSMLYRKIYGIDWQQKNKKRSTLYKIFHKCKMK